MKQCRVHNSCGVRCGFETFALLLLRVTVGVIMATHGWQKFQNIAGFADQLTSMNIPYPAIAAYLGIAGELLGGIGLIVGFLTPLAAFGVFFTMLVAVAKVHWANGLLASNNGYEYPLTLMMVAFYFIFRGAGCISLDGLFCKKKDCHTEEMPPEVVIK